MWEGDLEDGKPELTGSDSNVTHRAVDIHTDVVESPDFGLIVLALCAPRIARKPFDFTSSDDGPQFVLALLPLPLLVAQWGLLLSVFYQSIKDWEKSQNPFCFKESYDDNPDLNTTLYLCRVIMSFLCLLYLKRAFKTSTDLFAIIKQSSATKENLRRRGLFRIGSSIGIACLVDCCAELFMESFCLLINLWMVFGANKPIDMVLNSLALEFIKDIDNEFCQFFINEYPAIVATIEERLREKSYASLETYKNPTETLYGRFCMLLIDPLAQWAVGAAYVFSGFVNGFAPNIDDWRKSIPFWLLLGPVCLALWLVAISIVVAGFGFFVEIGRAHV